MSGADMEMCKVMEHKPLHWVVMYFVAVPVLLGFFVREIASAILTAALPTSSYMFILANYYLVQVPWWASVNFCKLVGVHLGGRQETSVLSPPLIFVSVQAASS